MSKSFGLILPHVYSRCCELANIRFPTGFQTNPSICLEKILARCFRVTDMYLGLPFVWNDSTSRLEIAPSRLKYVRLRLYLSIFNLILTYVQTWLGWKQIDLPTKMLVNFAGINVGICALCCVLVNMQSTRSTCDLTNSMQKYNVHYNFKYNPTESHTTLTTKNKQAFAELKSLHNLINATLPMQTLPVFYSCLIFIYPCIPTFVGNWALPECNAIYLIDNHMISISPLLIKLLSIAFGFFNWSFLYASLTLHLCLTLYHGYSFTLYISNYCR